MSRKRAFDEEKAIQLYKDGTSAEQLARMFDVSPPTIISCLKRNGIEIRRPKGKLDLLGKTFGRLLVIEALPRQNRRTMWRCKCSCEKGSIVDVRTDQLTDKVTTSCGCMHAETRDAASKRAKKYDNYWEASARFKWKTAYADGDITFEQFYTLSQQNCFYCDAKPASVCDRAKYDKNASKAWKAQGGFVYNGLDRIDSNIGHTINNVVPCCITCNWMKGPMTLDEFMSLLIDIYNHSVMPCEK